MVNHQLKTGLCSMPWAMTYYWVQILKMDSFSHDVEPSFHLQQMSQPAIDFPMVSLPLTKVTDPLKQKINHPFYDLQTILTRDIHCCQHHTGHTLTLKWC